MAGAPRHGPPARDLSMLILDVVKRLGDFVLRARFETESAATALFGPSGSGKTTIVDIIAGLAAPDQGRLLYRGRLLFDSDAGINLPAHGRGFGYVFQDGRLFPHLTVERNLEYGRRMRRLRRDAAEMLDIGHLLERRPGKLSGGERQRVAIGRALLMRPQLLLLDEPLASLDAARKAEIMPYLERLRDEGVPMIYVSHQAADIRRIAASVVRVEAGQVKATGGLELLDRADADAVR
jgi:molybdate transport system ATP-binding protein